LNTVAVLRFAVYIVQGVWIEENGEGLSELSVDYTSVVYEQFGEEGLVEAAADRWVALAVGGGAIGGESHGFGQVGFESLPVDVRVPEPAV